MNGKPEWALRYEMQHARATAATRETRRALDQMAYLLTVERCQHRVPGSQCVLDYGHAGEHDYRQELYPSGWEFQ